MSVATLQAAHAEANGNNGFVELLRRLREPGAQYSQRRADIDSIFRNKPLWEAQKTGSGHAEYKHAFTGVVVGWQAHGDANLKATQVLQIREAVQRHLNILHNEVFGFKSGGWKTPAPDFKKISEKLRND